VPYLLNESGTLAVEPVADRSTGESELAADVAEWHAVSSQEESSFAQEGWMHLYILEHGYDIFAALERLLVRQCR
jgi:hypothetical protein